MDTPATCRVTRVGAELACAEAQLQDWSSVLAQYFGTVYWYSVLVQHESQCKQPGCKRLLVWYKVTGTACCACEHQDAGTSMQA